jgi:hypothetical protein
MTVETAFCTSCGAVVGQTWEFCEACGIRQPVELTAIDQEVEKAADLRPSISTSVGSTPLTGSVPRTPAATYLLVIGGAFVVAGFIYLIATAGFPPSFTTTYEYRLDGATSTSTSPDTVEVIITVVLFLIGGVLLRASRAANSPEKQ